MRGGEDTIYHRMCSESKLLDEQIQFIESQLKGFPEGKLICKKNEKRYKWYHDIDGRKIYIPKHDQKFAESLAAKKYLMLLHEDLLHEQKAIEYYLRHHKQKESDKMLTEMSGYQKLLEPYFAPLSKELDEWMNSPYEQNNKYNENLKHKTTTGKLVRSKAEALIEMTLRKYRIPFRYECALKLGDVTFYPDFTLRHPKTGEEYYWEHFGKMDDGKYARGTGGKIQMYIANGIVPGDKLVATYETKKRPLSPETVENVIKEYFL